MLLEIDSNPLISPRPAIWRISTYVAPTPGRSSASTPHRSATTARCPWSAIERPAGSWLQRWPHSRPPWPLRCPVSMLMPQLGLPMCPQASATLIIASTLSVPIVCCSGPRAWRIMQRSAEPISRASSRTVAAGTSVAASTTSGRHGRAAPIASKNPTVRALMKSTSSRPWRSISASRPRNSAPSVPGRMAIFMSSSCTQRPKRGSMATTRAPR